MPPRNLGGATTPGGTYIPPRTSGPAQKSPPTLSGEGWNANPVKPAAKVPQGFDKPLRPTPPANWPSSRPADPPRFPRGGGLAPGLDRPVRTPVVSAAAPSDLRFVGDHGRDWGHNTSVFVSVGIGTGFSSWHYPPPPRFDGCFDWHHGGWAYPDPFWCRPWRHHDPFWAHDRWGCWYVRSWCYWPDWWWYPTFYYSTYPCGTFSYVTYSHCRSSWAFSFACSPAWGYSSCGLISPSVVAVYEPAPVYTDYSQPAVAVVAPSAPAEQAVASATPLPPPATSEQLVASSDRELADVYLRLGDTANAVRVYSDHIARFPGDVDAVRSLGVALIESDRVADGLEQIERAYSIDPSLAQRPWPREMLGDRLPRVLDSATRQAAQDNSARAWLAVAVLMQADGRAGPARAALDKARAAGLNARVVEWMQAALPAGQG